MRPQVIIKKARVGAIKHFHPWIFSGAVKIINHSESSSIGEGTLVDVLSETGEFLACGHWGKESIAVRILSFKPLKDEGEFIAETISRAYQTRLDLGLINSSETNAYRLVNAEGDGLPGLVVDCYNRTLVIQCHSQGMLRNQVVIIQVLKVLFGDTISNIISRHPVKGQEKDSAQMIYGNETSGEIIENSFRFLVDWLGGQKTGFFTDQRENRKLLMHYAKDRMVLDTFCHSGPFSVYALAAGARQVISVDASAPSIALTQQNIELNFSGKLRDSGKHQTIVADCLEYLKELQGKHNLIILDPPAFVKHRGALSGGCRGYESINYQALRQIGPRGIIFTFSCSAFVGQELFTEIVMRAAKRTGRFVRVLHQMKQAPCHPRSLFHLEGEYLKGLVLYVE